MNPEIDVKLSVENKAENKEQKKEKKILFSEKIDSSINGYAIGLTFVLISAFLLFNSTYFKWAWLTYVVGSIFGFIGLAGIGVELDKSQKVKGIGDIVIGLFFSAIWLGLYLGFDNNLVANLFSIAAMVIGLYGLVKGLIELFYSVIIETRKSDDSWQKTLKSIFVFLTQICGLVLSVLNILKIFSIV